MLFIVTDRVAWYVCLSVGLSPSDKTAEAIEMPFASMTQVGPGKHLLHIADRFEANTVLCLFNATQPSSSICFGFVVQQAVQQIHCIFATNQMLHRISAASPQQVHNIRKNSTTKLMVTKIQNKSNKWNFDKIHHWILVRRWNKYVDNHTACHRLCSLTLIPVWFSLTKTKTKLKRKNKKWNNNNNNNIHICIAPYGRNFRGANEKTKTKKSKTKTIIILTTVPWRRHCADWLTAHLKHACRCLDSERMMMIMMTTTITSNFVSVLYTASVLLLVSNSKQNHD